jgi:RimJ/RimL family protein N-acetyltransferase
MSSRVLLRDVADADLPTFFAQQRDPVANIMAAFTAKDPADRAAFMTHWDKILGDEGVTLKTILCDEEIAGYIVRHGWFGDPEVSYWLGREYWGRGVATRALALFLDCVVARPLYARVAKDNLASRRVLEKCGFTICGEDKGFANARGVEIEEYILRLDPAS